MNEIFFQFAMRLEAQPLIDKVEASRIHPEWVGELPFEFYQSNFSNLKITIGIAGDDPHHDCDSIGSVPAAVLANLALTHLRPDLILNSGTCGGFQSEGHAIGDVLAGTKYVAFHHRRSSISSMRDYGIGKYPVTDSSQLRRALHLGEGIVTSGDALDCSKEDEQYIQANGGSLKEMEAAAIGWVCMFYKVPLLPVKTVTDWVDHPADTGEQFLSNYKHAVDNLTAKLLEIINYLGKHDEDPVWLFNPDRSGW